MISLSRDGEYQSQIFRRFGWEVIRGSSGRGGVRALAAAVRKLKGGATLAFTPDGPRGPSHTIHPGVLFLSQKSGCPIFPLGMSSYPRWFLSTWDQYQVPHPFARAVILHGEPLYVPATATDADFEALKIELASRICALEMEAEARVTPPAFRQPCEVGRAIHRKAPERGASEPDLQEPVAQESARPEQGKPQAGETIGE